jgi:cytochrome P450
MAIAGRAGTEGRRTLEDVTDEDGARSEAEETSPATSPTVPTASALDTVGILGEVVLPVLARGVILRRPPIVRMAERLDLDRRAVRRLHRMHARYGDGPLLLRVPIRRQAVVLAPQHVRTVLEQAPEPFSPATMEKRAALSHFQPEGALVSTGEARAQRRRLNEQVLESDHPVHGSAERFGQVVDEEIAALLERLDASGELTWDAFAAQWFTIVRRVVLGDAARDDHDVTDRMAELRAAANWAFLRPKRRRARAELFERLDGYLQRAEPGSLVALMAATVPGPQASPVQQVPQWLFAFDPAGMATFRALALLVTHPGRVQEARAEAALPLAAERPFLRATVLESLRLWPTTPAVLRETTRDTVWEAGVLPRRTQLLLFAPYLHRDGRRSRDADRFSPKIWSDPRPEGHWPLVPFSDGPAICPGRNLVLLLGSLALARLVEHHDLVLRDPGRLDPDRPLPSVLDPFSLRFDLRRP